SARDTEHSQRELERRVFYLKTLYDVGQEIGALRDAQRIIQHMLLMIIGTFGIRRGMIILTDAQQRRIAAVTQRGMASTAVDSIAQAMESGHFAEIEGVIDVQALATREPVSDTATSIPAMLASARLQLWIPFAVDASCKGGIGLGEKL